MSRVIQLISHNQNLFALTDDGEIFQLRKRRVKCRVEEYWKKFQSPCDTTQPQEPVPSCQASASDESFVPPGQRESSFQQMNCVAPQAHSHQFLGIPILTPEDWMKPNLVVKRRPTSIGSDGNYLPPLGD